MQNHSRTRNIIIPWIGMQAAFGLYLSQYCQEEIFKASALTTSIISLAMLLAYTTFPERKLFSGMELTFIGAGKCNLSIIDYNLT